MKTVINLSIMAALSGLFGMALVLAYRWWCA